MDSAQTPENANTPVPSTEVADDGNVSSPHPAPKQPAAAGPSTVTAAEARAMQDILNKAYDHRTDDGHDPSKVFHKNVNKRIHPAYYDVIQKPMAMSVIKLKLTNKEYKSFTEFVHDFALISHNAQVYNIVESQAYQDAIEIKNLLQSELKALVDSGLITEEVATLPYLGEIPAQEEAAQEDDGDDDEDDDEDEEAEESDEPRPRKRGRPRLDEKREQRPKGLELKKRRGRPPKVDTPMEARIKNILKSMRRPKDAQGNHKISSFERLPDRTIMPEYYSEIRNPIALDVLKKKFKRKKYLSVDQFMQDVELMFENAKIFNEDASQIYRDAIDLQNETRRVAAEELAKPDSEFVMEDGKLPLPQGILHNGELYKVGDWVHVQNSNDLTKPIVAQLYRTWQDASGQKFINACWYYRPEQTVHRFDKHFFENEVVKTGQYRDHKVEEIVNRCFVMFVTRFNKGRPKDVPLDKEIHVCESRYNEDKHTFNKIKTWASCLPDEVRDKDYEMDIYKEPKRLKKQPSPIAYLLKDEQKETDPLPKAEWGADNAPPKIGAVHRRPKDPRESPPPEPTPPPQALPTPPPVQPQSLSQTDGLYRDEMPGSESAQRPSTMGNPLPHSQPPQGMQNMRAGHANISPAPLNRPGVPELRPNGYSAHTPQTSYQTRPGLHDMNSGGRHYPVNPATAFLKDRAHYKPPEVNEVFHLGESANHAIPAEIRKQFQRDEHGNILFFTAPPLDTSNISLDKEGKKLHHSTKYLEAKKKRQEELEERAKRGLPSTDEEVERKAKLAKLQRKTFDEKATELMERGMGIWAEQMVQSLLRDCEKLYGEEKGFNVMLSEIEAAKERVKNSNSGS